MSSSDILWTMFFLFWIYTLVAPKGLGKIPRYPSPPPPPPPFTSSESHRLTYENYCKAMDIYERFKPKGIGQKIQIKFYERDITKFENTYCGS